MLQDVLIIVGGYLVGSIPFGVVVVRLLRGEDIRTQGSGNIGASNVWRSYGRWLGVPVALLDVLKGFVPAYVGLEARRRVGRRPRRLGRDGWATRGRSGSGSRRAARWSRRAAASRSPSPRSRRASACVVWIATFVLFRYASLASIVTAVALPILCVVLGEPWPTVGFAVVAGLAVIVLHRQNIGRLLHGTESRFSRAADPAATP